MENFEIKNIRVVLGLGNPGYKYYKNRHNIGFRIIDKLVDVSNGTWQSKDIFELSEISVNSYNYLQKSIYVIKPLTFMNKVGQVLPFFLKKGLKAKDILVVHDELEKGFGKISIKYGGNARGHNGLRSIISVIGSDFWRLRFGIGRPQEKSDVANFVLSNFSCDQEKEIDHLIQKSVSLILKT